MIISELINKLNELKEKHGDINVEVNPDDGMNTDSPSDIEYIPEEEHFGGIIEEHIIIE